MDVPFSYGTDETERPATAPTDTTIRSTPAEAMDPSELDPNAKPKRGEDGKVIVPFTKGDATDSSNQ